VDGIWDPAILQPPAGSVLYRIRLREFRGSGIQANIASLTLVQASAAFQGVLRNNSLPDASETNPTLCNFFIDLWGQEAVSGADADRMWAGEGEAF
jgi:hypothetical protein